MLYAFLDLIKIVLLEMRYTLELGNTGLVFRFGLVSNIE